MKTKPRVKAVFEELERIWPNAKCELTHNTPYQLLLAVMLSAQTTDISVNKALTPLFAQNPTFGPSDLIRMGQDGFRECIKSIGLAPTKAKNAFLLSQILLLKFQGDIPRERVHLESLPGVGRKTANVVLNVIWGEPTIAVDTHVERVSKRLGFVSHEKKREDVEKFLVEHVPSRLKAKAHHLLIFHGRYHCTAKKPKCENCQIKTLCPQDI